VVGAIEGFGSTRDVVITVLVENSADLLVRSTDTVKRFHEKPLLAEHGFAALVELKEAGMRVLWDAGISTTALLENARLMEIDLSTVGSIALSHGHRDHFGAMTEVLKRIARRPESKEWPPDAPMEEMRAWGAPRRVPLIAHPAAFRERWGIARDGRKFGPHLAPREEWEIAGAEIVASEGPYQLGPGCWLTGAVPRRSYEEAGRPPSMHYREGDRLVRDELDDDQAIVLNIEDKGLVVISGCAHSGILNTVNYAREISGVDQVHAILGGFHLAPAKDDEIERTIDEIIKLSPAMVVPSHCTGFKAIARFASRMPDQFVQGVVGTRYLF